MDRLAHLHRTERASGNGVIVSEHHTALIVRVQVAAQAALPLALFGGLWLVARALDSITAALKVR